MGQLLWPPTPGSNQRHDDVRHGVRFGCRSDAAGIRIRSPRKLQSCFMADDFFSGRQGPYLPLLQRRLKEVHKK